MSDEHKLNIEGSTVVRWENDYRDGYVPRKEWAEGPWTNEPDRVEWRTLGSELPRMVLRGPRGSWCGYVGVPGGHWAFGRTWEDDCIGVLQVHGGVTYGSECAGEICHVPRAGETDHVWWIGFDCAHAGDLLPGTDALIRKLGKDFFISGEVYRDLDYVARATEELARQLDLER